MRILLKFNNEFEEELFITDFFLFFLFGENKLEKTPNQTASKPLHVILGLQYETYSNGILQTKLNVFCA